MPGTGERKAVQDGMDQILAIKAGMTDLREAHLRTDAAAREALEAVRRVEEVQETQSRQIESLSTAWAEVLGKVDKLIDFLPEILILARWERTKAGLWDFISRTGSALGKLGAIVAPLFALYVAIREYFPGLLPW